MPITSVHHFLDCKFDYLIVGGGTAGLVLATRLSEDPDCQVGVIEAGEYHADDAEVNVPGMMGTAVNNPKFDWTFYSLPEKYVNNRKILQSCGKGLGGSSLLNFHAFVRPTKDELDALERLGNPGWNWETTLKYMKKSEHLEKPNWAPDQSSLYAAVPDPAFHGTDGPISVSFPPHVSKLHVKILDSLEKLGLPRNIDSNTGKPVGSLLVPTSVDTKTATRSYAASAYYVPNVDRPNLLILTGAHVAKIRTEQRSDGLCRATGVEFLSEGKTHQAEASKEIILSTGSFQTPQLLELSGIGDKEVLSRFGIECHIDLPGVGENLQDHCLVPTIVEVDKSVESLELLYDPIELERQRELYSKQQKGILAGAISSVFAFLPAKLFGNPEEVEAWVSNSSIDASPPEIFTHTRPEVKRGITKQYEVTKQWVKSGEHPFGQLMQVNGHFLVPGLSIDPQKRYTTLLCAYTHPYARGTVHITSIDATVPPAIQQNYLSNPADLDILTKMLVLVSQLWETPPLADWVHARVLPPFSIDDANKEAIREYVRETLNTVNHPVGTAAMLPREDGGVVDSNLLVYGTSNLRVVDCSIIPLQLSSNIQTMAYAIGEKSADIIRGI